MLADIWTKDEEFGRQFLTGAHPVKIERLKTPPAEIPLREEHIQHLLRRNITMEEEFKVGIM